MLDLVSQVCDVVLMNVYLDLGDPGGRDFGMRVIWVGGGKWKDQFTSNLGTRWTGSYSITARRVPSKLRETKGEQKGMGDRGKQKARGLFYDAL